MTTDPSGVLASIDSALADFDLSEDAMRWTPEPQRVICDGGRLWPEMPQPTSVTFPAVPGAVGYTVYAQESWPWSAPEPGWYRCRWGDVGPLPAGQSITLTFDEVAHVPEGVWDSVGALLPPGMRFEWVADEPAPASQPDPGPPFVHRLAVDMCKAFAVPYTLSGHTHERIARCRECNPAGNPPPLAAKYKPGPKASRMRGRRR